MSEPKFTPGPWKIVETVDPSMVPDYHIKIGDDQISIFPYKRSYSEGGIQSGLIFDGEKIANANLIAAAPELYEALESFGPVWGECEECESSDGYAYLVPMDVMDEFREKQKAALAKARGESHD